MREYPSNPLRDPSFAFSLRRDVVRGDCVCHDPIQTRWAHTVGAFIVRIGFWGRDILYIYIKEPSKIV